MIDAVLFDLDGTLFDRETSVRNLVKDQFTRFAAQLVPATSDQYLALFTKLDRRGYVSKPAVYEQMRQELGFPVSSTALADDYVIRYAEFSVGFPHLAETLIWLKDRGLKTAIVTNGSTELQSAAIEALGIGHWFDAVVISEAVGMRKPDPGIFNVALEQLGVEARDSVFVGDHPDTDIRGAREAGMRTVWKRDDYWGPCVCADAVISGLSELQEALRIV